MTVGGGGESSGLVNPGTYQAEFISLRHATTRLTQLIPGRIWGRRASPDRLLWGWRILAFRDHTPLPTTEEDIDWGLGRARELLRQSQPVGSVVATEITGTKVSSRTAAGHCLRGMAGKTYADLEFCCPAMSEFVGKLFIVVVGTRGNGSFYRLDDLRIKSVKPLKESEVSKPARKPLTRANSFTRKVNFQLMKWLSATQETLRGKTYPEVQQLVAEGTGIRVHHQQLKKILEDMDLDLELVSRSDANTREDRTVVLSEAVLQIHSMLEAEFGSGLSDEIARRVNQVRIRGKVSPLHEIKHAKPAKVPPPDRAGLQAVDEDAGKLNNEPQTALIDAGSDSRPSCSITNSTTVDDTRLEDKPPLSELRGMRDESGRLLAPDGYPLGGLAKIREICAITGISRTKIHKMIDRAELSASKIGTAVRVPWGEVRSVFFPESS